MASVTQFENLTYNGFRFPVETELEINSQLQYDDADRAVMYAKRTLRATVSLNTDDIAGQTVNGVALTGINEADLPTILAAIEQAGQALTLKGTGFGDLSVNDGSGRLDVDFGPKPRVTSWKSLGPLACELVWQCDVAVPVCPGASTENALLSYNYSVSTSVDTQGYMTRTISGSFTIALTRVSGVNVTQGASDFWDADTIPPVPDDFRRTNIQTTESSDRRTLNFTVVDEEMPDAKLPADMVDCQASHSVQSKGGGLIQYAANLRMSGTLRKGVPKERMYTIFLALLADRIQKAVKGGAIGLIPMGISLEDPDIWGRRAANVSFNYVYTLATKASQQGVSVTIPFLPGSGGGGVNFTQYNRAMTNLAPASALWGPPKVINDYAVWRRSMEPVFGLGAPRFEYAAGDDVILDVCGDGLPGNVKGNFFRVSLGASNSAALYLAQRGNLYLRYETYLRLHLSTMDIVKQKVPSVFTGLGGLSGAALGTVVPNPGWLLGGPLGGAVVGGLAGAGSGNQIGGETVAAIQTVAPSKIIAELYFFVVRVGADPQAPILTAVGGLSSNQIAPLPGPMGGAVDDRKWQYSSHFGVPGIALLGHRRYYLTGVPKDEGDSPPNYYLDGVKYEPTLGPFNVGL